MIGYPSFSSDGIDKYQQILYENSVGIKPPNHESQDKYQQILYENWATTGKLVSSVLDKYQQILYENLFLSITAHPSLSLININRYCTKTSSS